ncbi:MAG: carbon-nitrogen hydrolase family protein [Deltaproteobacteria bacterium]|nr:carbon-nitrogen hydrolase family protein [Deltaproteobacteria bacterium]
MRVAAVQFKAEKGRRRRSLSALAGLAAEAASRADLVVLPEMAATGYLFPTPHAARRVAEPAAGPTFDVLAPVAAANRCWLVAGFPEIDRDQLFNSALVIDPAGALRFVYRKTLLFAPDEWWALPGDSGYRAFDTDAGRFGVGICMDLNDDGFVAWCAGADIDAIAFPTNWVQEDVDVWAYWRARLLGVDAALVAANTYGTEGPVTFTGRSAVLQRGVVLASAPLIGNAVIRADTH